MYLLYRWNGGLYHLWQILSQHGNNVAINPPLSNQLLHKRERLASREPLPIRPVLHHGLKNIGHPQDPRLQCHRRSRQMKRVSLSVRFFMVIGGPARNLFESLDVAQGLIGLETVGIYDGPLLGG